MLTREDHKTYEQILREELTPAFGCTEPIALAYCAAKAREVLGQMPTEVIIEASGNIIKNVKCKKTKKCRKRTKQNRKLINNWSRNGS